MNSKILKDFVKSHKISYIIGVFFMLLSSYIQTLLPKVLGRTIDILKVKNFNQSLVKVNILYILLIAAGTFISTYCWRNLVIGNARKMECYLRELLFQQFQRLSPEFYNKRKTGNLIAYAINDISAVRMSFGPATAMSINGVVVCVLSIYSMCQGVNWQLTLMSLIPIPIVIFVVLKIGSTVRVRFRKVQESFAAISDRVNENINGIRVIKSYVQEEQEVERFEQLNNDMLQANIDMVRASSFLSPVIELCFSVSFVLNLIIGGNMVLNNTISLGSFIAFNGYLTMIMVPIISIGRVINIMQRGTASLKRLNEIFDTEPAIRDNENSLHTPIKGDIEFKNLTFFYPGAKEAALQDITLKIPKGHTLGIIGKTGSGKSTLSSLLLKLYKIQNGELFIDGKDINDYSIETLRAASGYVPQDNFLFSASIRDNIKFFKNLYSDEQVEKAAQNSCIYDSIMDFPNGFDTMLGERGVNISGGQKQRISIARAIIQDPAVLILDDSLSAVDTITESQIIHNLNSIRKDKTAVIVAHRISAVEACDEIIVMDNGRILEKGTHQELLAKGGLYYGIYKEQFQGQIS